jgi:hypothetical protein
MKRHLIGAAAIVLGTALVGGVSVQTASAVDAPSTVTLPLFGAPLTIGITTGPGGALTEVTVDPADGNVATKTRPHKVVFESANPDLTGDPGKVTIRSKHGGQSVSARAGSLADVSGPGSWVGDVFGDGTETTVAFTIAAAADGGPDITGVTATGATGVVGEVKRSTDDDDDETSSSARVSVKFTNADGDQSRSVSISVRVKTDEDGTTSAKLSVSLGNLKGVAVAAADAAGPHTWTDLLCDGSTATITYDVAEDGTVSNVVATPAADVRTGDSKIDARFSNDERVRIRVREDDGLIKISVDNRIRCRDAEDPTFNGSVVPTTVDDDDEGDDNDGGHHGGGGGHDDDDDATSTTVTTTTGA